MNDAERAAAVGDGEGSSSLSRDARAGFGEVGGYNATLLAHEICDGFAGAFAQGASVEVDAAHAGVRGERNERRLMAGDFAPAQTVLGFREHHHGTAFGRL